MEALKGFAVLVVIATLLSFPIMGICLVWLGPSVVLTNCLITAGIILFSTIIITSFVI